MGISVFSLNTLTLLHCITWSKQQGLSLIFSIQTSLLVNILFIINYYRNLKANIPVWLFTCITFLYRNSFSTLHAMKQQSGGLETWGRQPLMQWFMHNSTRLMASVMACTTLWYRSETHKHSYPCQVCWLVTLERSWAKMGLITGEYL